MDISISPELERYIAGKVAAGQFDSASDVVKGALEVMRDEETLTADDIEELRAEVAVGLEQLDRGEGKPWNVEEIKAMVRRRLARKQR
jgi:antitoxin ParD1/3/4